MILDNAAEKIQHFNRIAIHYEAVYHYVIRRRVDTKDLFDTDFLDDITAGLISFDMQRMMGGAKYMIEGREAWASKLKDALQRHASFLSQVKTLNLQSVQLDKGNLDQKIAAVFDDLSDPAHSGLNRRKESERFHVGASKILHFLIPDFFIILDSNARNELAKNHPFRKHETDGASYVRAMQLYQVELTKWSQAKGDPDYKELIALDSSWKRFNGVSTTPLPRIVDKCTFAGTKI